MIPPWAFIVLGVLLALAVLIAWALCRIAAIADQQAELELERLPFRPRVVENEHAEFSPALAPVVSIHSRRDGGGGRAA